MTSDELELQLEKFIAYHTDKQTKSTDFNRQWRAWLQNNVQWKLEKTGDKNVKQYNTTTKLKEIGDSRRKRRGELLNELQAQGLWPRAFDCAQDKELATQQKQNIIQVREFYLSLLQPSEPTYILGKIEILESRYFEKETDQTVQTQLDREWIEDLSEYPPDLIELACNNWRRSSKNYAPRSAGVLMESVKQEYVRRVVTYRKAVSVLEIIDAD